MRHAVGAAVVVAVEGYVFWRYQRLGAEFHFWLHGLFGGAIGVAVLTAWSLLRRHRARPAWAAGFAGHLYSALPDALFLGAGILHQLWMDAFAFHIAVHLIPEPLVTMLGVFALSLLAWLAASAGRPAWAVTGLIVATAVTTVALLVAPPIPTTLQQLRDLPQIALLCPLQDLNIARR